MIVIANERIDLLFQFAEHERALGKYKKLDRYVDLARRIGMRYNVRLPANYKWKFCKHCYSYLHPGRTADVRTRNKFIVIHCRSCGKHMRRSLRSLDNDDKKKRDERGKSKEKTKDKEGK
jgi:ribonuclease P protein subunit RPR2